MSDIGEWLEGLGLGRYADAFHENEITLDFARDLTDGDLEKLGVGVKGHRKALPRAIGVLPALQTESVSGETTSPDQAGKRPEAEGPREAECRQITVMFCDMVGSTALSEKLDREDLCAKILPLLDAFRPAPSTTWAPSGRTHSTRPDYRVLAYAGGTRADCVARGRLCAMIDRTAPKTTPIPTWPADRRSIRKRDGFPVAFSELGYACLGYPG